MLNVFKKKNNKSIKISSPFDGEIVDITEVQDPAFSQKMLGDGIAIKPSNDIAKAPCDGTIVQIFPTNHAFGIVTEEGIEILVHIGIDTVQLEGKGFKRLVEPGTKVKKGKGVIKVDFDILKENGKDTTTPLIITNTNEMKNIIKNMKEQDEVLIINK